VNGEVDLGAVVLPPANPVTGVWVRSGHRKVDRDAGLPRRLYPYVRTFPGVEPVSADHGGEGA